MRKSFMLIFIRFRMRARRHNYTSRNEFCLSRRRRYKILPEGRKFHYQLTINNSQLTIRTMELAWVLHVVYMKKYIKEVEHER